MKFVYRSVPTMSQVLISFWNSFIHHHLAWHPHTIFEKREYRKEWHTTRLHSHQQCLMLNFQRKYFLRQQICHIHLMVILFRWTLFSIQTPCNIDVFEMEAHAPECPNIWELHLMLRSWCRCDDTMIWWTITANSLCRNAWCLYNCTGDMFRMFRLFVLCHLI